MPRPQEIDCQKIKEKAFELLDTEGAEEFSIRKLASKCNVAPSTIYLHYENKDAIMLDLAKTFWNTCFEGITLKNDGDFFAQLREIYFHVLKHLEQFKSSIIAYFSTMKFSQKSVGKETMNKYVSSIRSKIADVIKLHEKDFDENFIETVGIDCLTKFILDNLISMLMRNEHDYNSFELILKRIIMK